TWKWIDKVMIVLEAGPQLRRPLRFPHLLDEHRQRRPLIEFLRYHTQDKRRPSSQTATDAAQHLGQAIHMLERAVCECRSKRVAGHWQPMRSRELDLLVHIRFSGRLEQCGVHVNTRHVSNVRPYQTEESAVTTTYVNRRLGECKPTIRRKFPSPPKVHR